MKMTDVITGLRDIVPVLEKCVQDADKSAKEASDFVEDLRACRTTSGVLALADATAAAALKTLADVRRCLVVAGRLAALEQSYKRQFREPVDPRRLELEPDDPRRPELPGFSTNAAEAEIPGFSANAAEAEPHDLDPED